MSNILSDDNYTQHNTITLKGIKPDRVTTDPFKYDVTLDLMMLYKNGSNVSKKVLLAKDSAAYSLELDDSLSRNLD